MANIVAWSVAKLSHRGTLAFRSLRTANTSVLLAKIGVGRVFMHSGTVSRKDVAAAIVERDPSLADIVNTSAGDWSQWTTVARTYDPLFDNDEQRDKFYEAAGDTRKLYEYRKDPEALIADPSLPRPSMVKTDDDEKPESDTTFITLPRELAERLKTAAARDGSSVADLIARMLNAREGRTAKPRSRPAAQA